MLDSLVIIWTSTEPSEEMMPNHFVPLVPAGEVRSLGKGKLKILLIVFIKCLFFYSRKGFFLAVIFRTDHFFHQIVFF